MSPSASPTPLTSSLPPVPLAHARKPSWLNPLGLPAPLSTRQFLYILVPQCIGAAIIDGGINFAIAYAMYHAQSDITLWVLAHNTVAGDMGVTVFIQGTISFVITSAMVHVDMRKGTIDAFPYPWPDTKFATHELVNGVVENAPTRRGKAWRWVHKNLGLGRGLHFFSGSDMNDLLDFTISWKEFFRRLVSTIFKGLALSLVYFFLLWPLAILCIAPYWSTRNLAGSYTPELIKLVFAFILGIIMNPVCCCLSLGSEDSVRALRLKVHEKGLKELEEGPGVFNTEAEKIGRPEKARLG